MFVLYGKSNCSGCETVKEILSEKMLDYNYIDVSHPHNATILEWLTQEEKHRTVPQVYKQFQTPEGETDLEYIGDQHDLVDHLR